jgi:hypothetical protein
MRVVEPASSGGGGGAPYFAATAEQPIVLAATAAITAGTKTGFAPRSRCGSGTGV